MFYGISKRVVRYPKTTLGILLAITIFFAYFVPGITFKTNMSEMVPEDDPVLAELDQAVEDFGSQDTLMVVLKSDDVYEPRILSAVDDLDDRLGDVFGVDRVTSPLSLDLIEGSAVGIEISPVADSAPETAQGVAAYRERLQQSPNWDAFVSPDGTTMAILLTLHPGVISDSAWSEELATEIETIVTDVHANQLTAGEEIYTVGETYISHEATKGIQQDMLILFPLTILIVIATLYLSFRTRWGIILPLVTVVMSLVWTVGLMAWLGYSLTIISMVLPIVLVAIGCADAIHILSTYLEERSNADASTDNATSVLTTMRSMNGPVAMTSLTTAAGFAALLSSFMVPVKEFGVFTGLGVLFAMVVALVGIPAVLTLWPIKGIIPGRSGAAGEADGTRATDIADTEADPVPAGSTVTDAGTKPRGLVGRILHSLSGRVVRSPKVVIGVGVIVAILFALGIPGIRIETNTLEYFRDDSPIVKGTEVAEEYFGGTSAISVVIDTKEPDGVKNPDVLRGLLELEDDLERVEYVSHSSSIAGLIQQINRALRGGDEAFYTIPDTQEAVAQELLLFSFQGGSGIDSMVSYDYSKALVSARMANVSTGKIEQVIGEVEALVDEQYTGSGMDVSVVGIPKVSMRLLEQFSSSQLSSLSWSMVTVALIVALMMGSVIAGLLAIVPMLLTVTVNFGIMGYFNIPLDIATIMIASISIGIGVDYSIHFMSRYRNEVENGRPQTDALRITGEQTGRAILVNALTIVLGFIVLVGSNFRALATFGMLIALAMVISAIAALTLLPGALGLLRPHAVSSKRRGATTGTKELQSTTER